MSKPVKRVAATAFLTLAAAATVAFGAVPSQAASAHHSGVTPSGVCLANHPCAR